MNPIFVSYAVFAVTHIILLFIFSFILWMAVDAAKNDKYWWVVLVLGLPLAGAVIYYFVEKKYDYLKVEEKVVE